MRGWTAILQHVTDRSIPCTPPDTQLFGLLMRSLQTIFVSRTDKDSRATVAREIERRTKAERGQWHRQLLIFPEGTTTNGSAIITFKVRRRSCVSGGGSFRFRLLVDRSLARSLDPTIRAHIDRPIHPLITHPQHNRRAPLPRACPSSLSSSGTPTD